MRVCVSSVDAVRQLESDLNRFSWCLLQCDEPVDSSDSSAGCSQTDGV